MGAALFTSPGAQTWTCPAGVTAVTIECWGSGGSGADGVHLDDGIVVGDSTGGGGGGGAYARKDTLSVIPGHTYNLVVAAGGSSTPTSFESDCAADFGLPGSEGYIGPGESFNLGQGGVGGRASNSTGDVAHNGNSGGSNNGGAGASGGAGGTGGFLVNATPGVAPGGGGGGGGLVASGTQTGAAGAAGQVLISWPSVQPLGIPSGEAFGTATLNFPTGESTLPAGVYTQHCGNAGASTLPSGVYTSHAMTTSGKTIIAPDTDVQFGTYQKTRCIVSPDTGAQFGSHQRLRSIGPGFDASFRQVSGLAGTTDLPAGVYTSHSMTTSGKTVISPDTDIQFGRYFRQRVVMLGGDQDVAAVSIASAEAFGNAILNYVGSISPTSIASAEALGTPFLEASIGALSIATAEAFGAPTILANADIQPAAIASAEAFGSATIQQPILIGPFGIASTEHFGGTVIKQPMSIKLKVNGTDRTTYLHYESGISWNLMQGQRGSCTLPLIVEPGDSFSPQIGEPIEIFDPTTDRRWAGTIETADVHWLGDDGWHVVTITGVTYESLFDTTQVDKLQYTNTAAGTIFAALFAASGITAVSLGTVDAGATIASMQVTRLSDAFNSLALQSNKAWGIDPATLEIYFRDPTAVAAPWTMAAEDMVWESMRWKQTRADFRDSQVIQLPDGSAQVTIGNTPDPSIGTRAQRLTLTSAFTAAGAVQEATAALKRYSTMPSQLVVDTDKPGISTGQVLTIDVDHPLEAGPILNGAWMVVEVDARVLPGLDQMDPDFIRMADDLVAGDKIGHFRYTLHLVNSLATAIFQGDGSSTVFTLPIVPGSIASMTVFPNNGLYTKSAIANTVTVTPAMPAGSTLVVTYAGDTTPGVPSFLDTLGQMVPLAPTAGPAGGDSGEDVDTHLFAAELSLTDLTAADDIAPHPICYHGGTAVRGLAVLRKTLSSDLTVRINKNGHEIVTVTIPDTTVVDTVIEFDVVTGSPPLTAVFADKDVLSADILEGDGQIDKNGVAVITIQWSDTF